MFRGKVLKEIFGSKRLGNVLQQEAGENTCEKFHDLCFSLNIMWFTNQGGWDG